MFLRRTLAVSPCFTWLTSGDNPLPGKGSLVELILSDVDHPNEWGAKVKKTNGGVTEVTIFTPSICPVGKWRLKIDIIRQDDKAKKSLFRYTHPLPIYILFNPWCKRKYENC